MIHRFGADPAQTGAPFADTLAAGGGWTFSPPGWGSGREPESAGEQ
jgi:hypothetical protein